MNNRDDAATFAVLVGRLREARRERERIGQIMTDNLDVWSHDRMGEFEDGPWGRACDDFHDAYARLIDFIRQGPAPEGDIHRAVEADGRVFVAVCMDNFDSMKGHTLVEVEAPNFRRLAGG